RLVERRANGEPERGTGGVPNPIVVGSDDSKGVPPRPQVGVERLALVASVLPIRVGTLELESEVHSFGDREAACRIINPQLCGMNRKVQVRIHGRVSDTIAADTPYRDGWRKPVSDNSGRINQHQPSGGREPHVSLDT